MTSNYSKYDMFAAYRNPDRISNMIQNKISNIAENEVIFPSVDYSEGYNEILEKYSYLFDGSSNGNNSTENTTGNADNSTVENPAGNTEDPNLPNNSSGENENSTDENLSAGTIATEEDASKETTEQAAENTVQKNILTGKQRKKVYNSNGKVAKTQTQRNTVLKNKVENKEILNLQDAYKAGFDESEVRAAGLYNRLEKAGTIEGL